MVKVMAKVVVTVMVKVRLNVKTDCKKTMMFELNEIGIRISNDRLIYSFVMWHSNNKL